MRTQKNTLINRKIIIKTKNYCFHLMKWYPMQTCFESVPDKNITQHNPEKQEIDPINWTGYSIFFVQINTWCSVSFRYL